MWRIVRPSEYLVITGVSIEDVKLAKAALIWPTVYTGKTKTKGKVGAGQTKYEAVKTNLETKVKMKGKVGAGQTKQDAVKTDLETRAKMKCKVGAGWSKHDAVRTDLETKVKMKAVKTDLEIEITARGTRKVAEIKETAATRAAKVFKNQATKDEARPRKGDNGKYQQKGGNIRQQHIKSCLKDPKRPSKGPKKTVRFNLPEDDLGSRCKRQTGELHRKERGRGERDEHRTLRHYGRSSRTPLLTGLSMR